MKHSVISDWTANVFTVLCVFALLLTGFPVGLTSADIGIPGEIMIREDGTVVGTDQIMRQGNAYTFVGDITITKDWCSTGLQILKDNVIIDGNHHTLTIIGEGDSGVELTNRNGVTVKNLQIIGFNRAVLLDGSLKNIVQDNILIGSGKMTSCGIWFNDASNNLISRNSITTFKNYSGPANLNYGILIQAASTNNYIEENAVENCQSGIVVSYCGNNTLKNNHMANSLQNFQLSYNTRDQFIQNIDYSNTVDGKPIIYWLDEHGKTVPSNAGFVALGDCTNITIKDLNITHNFDGISLMNTNDSTIEGCQVTSCGNGIFLSHCQNASVVGNIITGNQYSGIGTIECKNIVIAENNIDSSNYGITPSGATQQHVGGRGSTEILIVKNNITNCDSGIYFAISSNNTIARNLFKANLYGINLVQSTRNNFVENTFVENKGAALRMSDAFNNTFFHNNFFNNTLQSQVLTRWFAPAEYETNTWDNGVEGNYWDNLHDRYTNSSQVPQRNVWDTSFYIDDENIDHYPLMRQVDISQPPDIESLPITIAAGIIALTVIIGIILLAYRWKHHSTVRVL